MSIQGYFLVLILVLVMAGMVALAITQNNKGGHQGKAWHQYAGFTGTYHH